MIDGIRIYLLENNNATSIDNYETRNKSLCQKRVSFARDLNLDTF